MDSSVSNGFCARKLSRILQKSTLEKLNVRALGEFLKDLLKKFFRRSLFCR